MELMIVVVILGILVAIAIPVYNGVQNRAKQGVGDANATMLNRGVRTLELLGFKGEDGTELIPAGATYSHTTENHFNALLAYLSLEDGKIDYVAWDPAVDAYVTDITIPQGSAIGVKEAATSED